jgi:hypothetical protein
MANRYGEAAIMAAKGIGSATGDPKVRWENALLRLYPTSPAARKKGAPRGAFLGLCEEGLVSGIAAGRYTPPTENKSYAVKAAALLLEGAERWSITTLWKEVTKDAPKEHDCQMDVVLALWKNNLIVRRVRKG